LGRGSLENRVAFGFDGDRLPAQPRWLGLRAAFALPQAGRRTNIRFMFPARARGRCHAGPAILLTHSRSGAIGWVIANDSKGLVKGIIGLSVPSNLP
jgi:hypothetical protein